MACVVTGVVELGVSLFSGVCVGTCSLVLTVLEHDGWHTWLRSHQQRPPVKQQSALVHEPPALE